MPREDGGTLYEVELIATKDELQTLLQKNIGTLQRVSEYIAEDELS